MAKGELILMGPTPGSWHDEEKGRYVAGRFLEIRDKNGEHLIRMKFQYLFVERGDDVYYVYVPLFEGEALKHFVRDLCEVEGIDLDELKELGPFGPV